MEVETVGNLKFGMAECVPQEDVCPSADGMSSDATVLCIDSDVEDEVQSQDDFNPDLERRLKEKGLQGGPEPHAQFKTFAQPTSVISNVPVHDGKQYTQEDLHGKRRNEGRVGEQDMFKIAQGGKKVSWGRQQEIEAKAVAAAMRSLEAKVKKQFGVGGQGSFYAVDDRWKADDMRGQRRKKVNNNINIGKEGKRGALYGPWAQEKKLDVVVKAAECTQVNAQQQGQRGNKRRGRRGGRGRRNPEREVVDEVPKLEKSLEEELAEQMANQASNESALAQSFSSLRLHVAGGGTMIILNDREITDGESAEDILNELEQTPRSTISPTSTTEAPVSSAASPPPPTKPTESERPRFPTRTSPPFRPQGMGGITQPPRQHGVGPAMNAFRPNCRGCGAFFPPNLLAQVKGDGPPLGMHLRRSSAFNIGRHQHQSNLRVPKLNARAMPFVPVGSPPSAAQHARSATHFSGLSSSKIAPVRKNGTGCFIPMYVRAPEDKPTLNSCKQVHKASLAESLSSLSEVDFSAKRSRLKLQPPPRSASPPSSENNCTVENSRASGDGSDNRTGIVTRCLRERSMSMGGCGFAISKHVRNPTTPAEELLSLLDKEDEFTTFTSPLHLEETLEGLEAEQQALEETQEKMIDLEMENCDLKNTINSINTLTSEIDKLKCANTALQVMLFVALAKPENLRIGADIPRGMFGAAGQLELHELEAVQEKLTTKSAELMQIQKVLEKKNSELQALSTTWFNGLGKTKKKKEIAVSPVTPRVAKETTSTPPATTRVLSGGKSDVVTPRRALSARGPSTTSRVSASTTTPAKTPATLTRKPIAKTTTTSVTRKAAEKLTVERLPMSAREPTVPRRTLSGAESARTATPTATTTTTVAKKPTTPLVFAKRVAKKSLWR